MPLLLTPPTPFATAQALPATSAYAILNDVRYSRAKKLLTFACGYYASEAACVAQALPLDIVGLPTAFELPVTPEQANAVPIFQFIEQALAQQLTALLGDGTTIEAVG